MSETKKRRAKSRGNGTGTAFKRGSTWTAQVVIGWKVIAEDKPLSAITRSKSGFKTRDAALRYCPILKAGPQKPVEAPTLEHYWETYKLGKYTALSPSKQQAYRTAWKKLAEISKFRVDQLTVADLQRTVQERCTSFYTAKDVKTVLVKLFEIAAAEGYVNKELPEFISLPSLVEKEKTPFSETEQAALWRLYESGDISGALAAVDDAFSSSAMDSREAEDVNDKIGINAEINFLRYIYLLYNYGADKDIPCIFKNNVVEDTGYSLDDLKVCCSNGDVLVSLEQACRLITREDNGKTYIDRPGPITAYAMTKEIHDETLFSKEDFNGVSTYKVDGNGAGYYIDSAISALPKAVSPSGFATSFYNSVSLAANSKGDLVVWRQLPNLKSEIRKISGIHNDIVTKVVSHIDSSDKHTVFFLPGEKDFIAYNYKKTLCYNFESGELLSEYPGTFPAISRNGKTIAVLDRALGNKISFYNTFSGQHLKDLDFSESVRKMIFINDCSLMLVLCKDGTLYVYDYQNEIFDKILLGTDNGNVYDMVLSDDRRYLIVHNMIHEIRVYRMVWHYQQKNDM